MILNINGEEKFIDDKIIILAVKMQNELESNNHKGSIFDWNPSFQDWLYEFEYHKSKLIAAIMAKDKLQQDEYTADLGNYLLLLIFGTFNIQKSFTLTESNIKILK
jgi:hypothetical protein